MFDSRMDNIVRRCERVLTQTSTSETFMMRPQSYLNDGLLLRGKVLLYVLLQSSQHHGLQNALQFLNLRHTQTQLLALHSVGKR